MDSSHPLILPDLVLLTDCGNDVIEYLKRIYACFVQDFIFSKPTYRTVAVELLNRPKIENKDGNFYHFINRDSEETPKDQRNEENRQVNFRRTERIRWPRPIIDNSESPDILVWEKNTGREKRILLWYQDNDYLVVLERRKEKIHPWTAYPILYENTKRKLLKEYTAYQDGKKAKTAQK